MCDSQAGFKLSAATVRYAFQNWILKNYIEPRESNAEVSNLRHYRYVYTAYLVVVDYLLSSITHHLTNAKPGNMITKHFSPAEMKIQEWPLVVLLIDCPALVLAYRKVGVMCSRAGIPENTKDMGNHMV